MTQSRSERKGRRCCGRVVELACLILVVSSCGLLQAATPAQATPVGTGESRSESGTTSPTRQPIERADPGFTTAQRTEQPEKILQSTTMTEDKAEHPSPSVRLLTAEVITYLRWIMVALIAIIVSFPVTVWLMSRKRMLALSGLSEELAATLLMVEKRQSKRSNILREIQDEGCDLQTMSRPELKAFVAEAKKYLEQNEPDVEESSGRKDQ